MVIIKDDFPLKEVHIKKKKKKNLSCYTCQTTGLIYLISCIKCGKQNVGQTGRKCVQKFGEHLYYVTNNTEATGSHFNSKGHDHSHMRVQIIKKVFPNTDPFRLERERFWIQTLKTPKGINIQA